MYKYEMHLHTNFCSACALSTGEEYVLAAKAKGYAGIILTNHFYHGNTCIDRKLPWNEFVQAYKDDYHATKRAGDKYGVDVLFGIEEGYGGGKEALIYGIDPDLIINTPEFCYMSIDEISAFVRTNDGFIACAHPFRARGYITDPRKEPNSQIFDAAESYNAGNCDEDNALAEEFCKKAGLPRISGGDVHSIDGLGRAGLAFHERITTNEQLATALKQGNYKLIINGEIEE